MDRTFVWRGLSALPAAAIAIALAFSPSPLLAQDAGAGPDAVRTVDGTILNPGAVQPMEILFDFSGSGATLSGAIRVPGVENLRIELRDVLVTDSRLDFSFTEPSGTEAIECSLRRLEDGSFRGDCFLDGQSAEMTIEPVALS